MYPLLTQVSDLETQTHLCLCTYIASLSKSLFTFLPRSRCNRCVSFAGTLRIELGMFAQGGWCVCN